MVASQKILVLSGLKAALGAGNTKVEAPAIGVQKERHSNGMYKFKLAASCSAAKASYR